MRWPCAGVCVRLKRIFDSAPEGATNIFEHLRQRESTKRAENGFGVGSICERIYSVSFGVPGSNCGPGYVTIFKRPPRRIGRIIYRLSSSAAGS